MKVSQETCKLAKEKGYSSCTCGVGYPDCICKGECYYIEQHELMKWLRDTHKIYLLLYHDYSDTVDYTQWIPINKWCWEVGGKDSTYEFNSYEEACEAGLVEALKLIK